MIKIRQLEISNHPILGNQVIDFIGPGEEHEKRYVTLMIGQNGTGKTQILKVLIDILFVYNNYDTKTTDAKWDGSYQFTLKLAIDRSTFSFKSEGSNLSLSEDGFVSIAPEKLSKLIVSSYTFNDKFPRAGDDKFYFYGGLKTTTNNIFLNKPAEDTFRNLSKIIQAKDRITYLNALFEELNFEKKINVHYRKGKNFGFLQKEPLIKLIGTIRKRNTGDNATDIDVESFRQIFNSVYLKGGKLRSKRFQDTGINRILGESKIIKQIIRYLATLKNEPVFLEKSFEYDWSAETSIKAFFNHIDVYKHLMDLGVVSFSHFQIFRNKYFNFDEASSGEFHLIQLAAGILANIEKNSLVLIDEPEISLHVNWQNRFFKFLQPIFKNFPESHFIIASHSHFLVSNLHNRWSSIVSLKRDAITKDLIIRLLDNIDPEGWSAEQILFDVFDAPTDRNYYLTLLVENIISELGRPKQDDNKISELILKLKKFDIRNLHQKDPMTQIIQKLISYEMEQKQEN